MNKIIGLTGPSGSGKSSTSDISESLGLKVINCDMLARKATEKGSSGLSALSQAFGKQILNDDGSLNRKKLAALAFKDKNATELLNNTILPYIAKLVAEESAGRDCLLDAPTLFESGIDSMCCSTVAVLADRNERIKRIIKRDTLTNDEANLRIDAGKTDDYYKSRADYILFNNGNLETFRKEFVNIINNILGGKSMSEVKTVSEELKEKLFYKRKNGRLISEQKVLDAADKYCEGYKKFLNSAKTEREAVKTAIKALKENGFSEYEQGKVYKKGDRVYVNNRGKTIAAIVIGSESVESGVNIAAAHIDSPRIDLKPNPLYEEIELALFKTHYYGGIKKYQWTTIPLALHGVFAMKDGTVKDVCLGEDDNDPKFVINDLLPHLSSEQSKRTLNEGIKGEELNILIGSHPFKDDKGSELVKLNILKLLNEKYGITEEDFLSAELEFVPANKSSDIGFDRSLIGAYGQDDRVCAYPILTAMLEVKNPLKTAIGILTDKEEIGSVGNTGLDSDFLRFVIHDLAKMQGGDGTIALRNSRCLSADVNAGMDPTFQDVMEKKNAALLNHGVVLTKYTGARGKSSTSDASAEYVAEIRAMLDRENIVWQTGELGKVDIGGGGTVAMYIANMGVNVIDLGVPVLSMHAPFETTAKFDVYMCHRTMYEFMK